MPLILAAIISLGSFFGYVGVQSGTADKVVHNIESSIYRPPLILDLQCRDEIGSSLR